MKPVKEGLLSLLPPSSLEEVLGQIAYFPDEAFVLLREGVRGEEGFDTSKERCERLGRAIGVSPEGIVLLLSALSFLYTRIISIPENEALSIFEQFADNFDDANLNKEDKKKFANRLSNMLAPSEQINLSRKLNRLRSGFMKNAVGFSSFVDARPDFTGENSHVRGFVLMTQIRITTDSDSIQERDFAFQIDESGLKALKKTIDGAEKKIETLKAGNILGASIYKRQDNG